MNNSWLNIDGKVVIVTGGASGIGREISKNLSENGANVVVADINLKDENLIKELSGENKKALFVKTDVTNKDSVTNMVEKVFEKYGKIDVLVNNAGINMPRLLVDVDKPNSKYELDEKMFDKMFAVNQKGTFLCSQAAARKMAEQKKGIIINVTSECGLEGSQGQSCYAGTKGAIYALTRSWAKELGEYGIKVVGIAPGIIEKTGMRSQEYEESLAYTRGTTVEKMNSGYQNASIPLKRVGKLTELADLICYLASERSSYIHGVTVNISGGKSRG